MRLIFSILLIILCNMPLANAHIKDLCNLALDDLPIQQNGRVKPLKVHAYETMKYLTGNKLPKEMGPTQMYCHLSLNSLGITDQLNLKTFVGHDEAREFLKAHLDGTYLSFEKLMGLELEIKGKIISIKRTTSYKKELNKLYNRLDLYRNIKLGQDWVLPQLQENEIQWSPLAKVLESAGFADLENATSSELSHFLSKLKDQYISVQGDDHLLELTFAKAKLFHWAMVFVIICLILQVLSSSLLITRIALGLTIGVQVLAIILRVVISGRAPVTNMYETVMFSGLGSLILACIISFYRKEKIYISAGLAYNFCCLMMMNFAYGMLNPGISPLVPVLRDNFWLSTHVTMVVFSYGALALSWALSNFVLIKNKFSPLSSAEYRKYSDLIYTCDKYGTICLSAGVILGGVWADYSWGRFWGWDPKETWSLIVLLIYLAILHGRNTSWIPSERFVALNAAAFMSVMMAWFGVNYILAAGLHSYGFSEGGAIFLGSFFAAQVSILLITGFKVTSKID